MLIPELFPPRYFCRQDETEDELFYREPRRVVHLDDGAIACLSERFGELLAPGGVYLDLMSSWRSHLPESLLPAKVVGLGMNAAEMDENPQVQEYTAHNLNRSPVLPFPDGMFDGVLCTVSVQYLTKPIAVFQAVNRILKPGCPFVVSFSNRCFPQKAVAVWLAADDAQHVALVRSYFDASGNWMNLNTWDNLNARGEKDPMFLVWATKRN
ncbi:MAG: class I SAM-dependent methyltransferase [bacterium]|nr:class I SAM-dependent methyltransferase [bacterium]